MTTTTKTRAELTAALDLVSSALGVGREAASRWIKLGCPTDVPGLHGGTPGTRWRGRPDAPREEARHARRPRPARPRLHAQGRRGPTRHALRDVRPQVEVVQAVRSGPGVLVRGAAGAAGANQVTVRAWDRVRVTGRIISEPGHPLVQGLVGIVATVSADGRVKVWPSDLRDPSLPAEHDGKFWFDVSDSKIEVLS